MLRIALLLAFLFSGPAFAVQPDEVLADPQLEGRARALSRDLRCLVCQNQSIDDSNAPLARDLRVIVRERLSAGDSDGEVIEFVTARYGDYVLLRTPFKTTTYLLWLGPLILLAAGAVAIAVFFLRRARNDAPGAAPLTTDERARLERLLNADIPR